MLSTLNPGRVPLIKQDLAGNATGSVGLRSHNYGTVRRNSAVHIRGRCGYNPASPDHIHALACRVWVIAGWALNGEAGGLASLHAKKISGVSCFQESVFSVVMVVMVVVVRNGGSGVDGTVSVILHDVGVQSILVLTVLAKNTAL